MAETTHTEYALKFEDRKPRDGEKPEPRIAPMSKEDAEKVFDYWSKPQRHSTSKVVAVTMVTRTVVTTTTDWEDASERVKPRKLYHN